MRTHFKCENDNNSISFVKLKLEQDFVPKTHANGATSRVLALSNMTTSEPDLYKLAEADQLKTPEAISTSLTETRKSPPNTSRMYEKERPSEMEKLLIEHDNFQTGIKDYEHSTNLFDRSARISAHKIALECLKAKSIRSHPDLSLSNTLRFANVSAQYQDVKSTKFTNHRRNNAQTVASSIPLLKRLDLSYDRFPFTTPDNASFAKQYANRSAELGFFHSNSEPHASKGGGEHRARRTYQRQVSWRKKISMVNMKTRLDSVSSSTTVTNANELWHTYKHTSQRVALVILIGVYAAIGGVMFMLIEGPLEKQKIQQSNERIWNISKTICMGFTANPEDEKCRSFLASVFQTDDFKEVMTAHVYYNDGRSRKWSFRGSLFYSISIFSTIGFGYRAPISFLGQLVTVLYSTVGIPFFLYVLADLGFVMNQGLRHIWGRWSLYWLVCPWNRGNLSQGSAPDGQIKRSTKSHMRIFFHVTKGRPIPVYLAIGASYLYIFIGGAIFLLCDPEWSYWTAFYFCFQTLSTIGLGDVVPRIENLFNFCVALIYILIGLAMVSMCMAALKEHIQKKYENIPSALKTISSLPLNMNKIAAVTLARRIQGSFSLNKDSSKVPNDVDANEEDSTKELNDKNEEQELSGSQLNVETPVCSVENRADKTAIAIATSNNDGKHDEQIDILLSDSSVNKF